MAEAKLVRHYAAEGLSLARTVTALEVLNGIKVSRSALSGFAARMQIRFRGENGAPFGNTNRLGTGKPPPTLEEKRQKWRENTRQYRTKLKQKDAPTTFIMLLGRLVEVRKK